MTKDAAEKIDLNEADRQFVLDHLTSNARRASGMGMHGMYKAWISAANAFGQATKNGETE